MKCVINVWPQRDGPIRKRSLVVWNLFTRSLYLNTVASHPPVFHPSRFHWGIKTNDWKWWWCDCRRKDRRDLRGLLTPENLTIKVERNVSIHSPAIKVFSGVYFIRQWHRQWVEEISIWFSFTSTLKRGREREIRTGFGCRGIYMAGSILSV